MKQDFKSILYIGVSLFFLYFFFGSIWPRIFPDFKIMGREHDLLENQIPFEEKSTENKNLFSGNDILLELEKDPPLEKHPSLDNYYSKEQEKISSRNRPYITIGNLDVMKFDLDGYYEWTEADSECSELGNGWRLPTIEELNFLYENKNKIGNFKETFYWSESQSLFAKENQRSAIYFGNGTESYLRVWDDNRVRPVRNKNNNNIPTKTPKNELESRINRRR